MKKPHKDHFLAIIFILSLHPVFAQSKTDSTHNKGQVRKVIIQSDSLNIEKVEPAKKKIPYFEAGISYQNDDVYLGRKDSDRVLLRQML